MPNIQNNLFFQIITARNVMQEGNVLSSVCLSVSLFNSGGGGACDLILWCIGAVVYKQLHQARPISWCLESK